MNKQAIIPCKQCQKSLRVRADRGTLRIRCPYCQVQFVWSPDPPQHPKPEPVEGSAVGWPGWLKVAGAIGVLVCVFGTGKVLGDSNGSEGLLPSVSSPIKITDQASRQRSSPQWLRISYDELIDKRIITHSGQTIGAFLDRISGLNSSPPVEILSNLQPYLEFFSFVCNEVVAAARRDDITPYLNVTADYPAGSRQPAWAALFREGRYQLFVGDTKARLFLKGKRAPALFSQYYGVIRHPLKLALEMVGTNKMTVEVYAFENDYASRTMSLDINPFILEINADQLDPKLKTLPLADLSRFFDQGITLDAAEIDGNGNFYLYGTPSPRQTIASGWQSLEDFAVVYRSVFHYGHNAPFISLDRHEDNRYAKVNFGGLLEDTRVGSVVLEADKLFKTIWTGFDPNTRVIIREKIRNAVPDFETEDERGLRENETGLARIRYWFYPDRIRTVTDGRIGVVECCQFMADAERMDVKATLGRAQRETIDHLNRKFAEYTQALPTYRELNTVGRMMAIATWLQQSGAGNRVDLDALLSVEISPLETPRRIKKLLAVTARLSVDDGMEGDVGARCKVYNLETVLNGVKPSTEEMDILDLAKRYFSKIKGPEFVPSEFQNAEAKIRLMEARIKSLESRIEQERNNLDQSSKSEVDRFNAMVDEFNSLRAEYNDAIDSYNRSLGEKRTRVHNIVSLNGGINLRPEDFAKPLQVPGSPLIQRIRSGREILRSSPSGVSVMDIGAARPYPRPWTLVSEESVGELTKKRWSNGSQGSMSVEANPESGYSHYQVVTEGFYCETTVKPGRKEMVLATSVYPAEIVATGDFSEGGTIILHKGKKIAGSTPLTATE
jgi:hypothetical protein